MSSILKNHVLQNKVFINHFIKTKEERKMEMSNAMNVLEKNGIKTKLTTVNKDGKMKDALAIGTGSIVPTIYQENLDQIRDASGRFSVTVKQLVISGKEIEIGIADR